MVLYQYVATAPPPLTSTQVPNPIMGIFAPFDSEIFVFSISMFPNTARKKLARTQSTAD